MKNNISAILLIFLLSAALSFAQTPAKIVPPPGNMSLLFGYEHKRLRGIDTAVGEISKKDGLVIRYDIGGLAGNYLSHEPANAGDKLVWLKALNVNAGKLNIGYLSSGRIVATFVDESANFFANTKNLDEVEDFLVMIMTYVGDKDLAALTPPPPMPEEVVSHKKGDCWKARPPGQINLLDGYDHSKCRGIDSTWGTIARKDGLQISYDIGIGAGTRLRQEYTDGKPWFREVEVNGDTFLLMWVQVGDIVATFVKSSANFFANVKGQEDLIDFILTVMTYHSHVTPPPEQGPKR